VIGRERKGERAASYKLRSGNGKSMVQWRLENRPQEFPKIDRPDYFK
jgi:hypothetical protein